MAISLEKNFLEPRLGGILNPPPPPFQREKNGTMLSAPTDRQLINEYGALYCRPNA
jgi:hypothetical protein